MAFEDEIPAAPQQVSGPEAGQQATFEDTIDPSMFEGVGKMGDAIPVGTYEFRLLQFGKALSKPDPAKNNPGGEPYYELTWSCTTEPYVGRQVRENCPWVKSEDTAAAKAGDSAAKNKIKNRLMRANTIMDACSFKPDGSRNFEAFLSDHPELKLTLGLEEMKTKESGYKQGSGDFRNVVKKYVSLRRPS